MAKKGSGILYIGIGSHAVALDAATGTELWRTKLKTTTLVTVQHEGSRLFAGAAGELFCLDAATGEILWRNRLKGLGTGLVTFAYGPESAAAAAQQMQEAAAAAAAAAAVTVAT
jgi:outer membrane protein assembly factor BamB